MRSQLEINDKGVSEFSWHHLQVQKEITNYTVRLNSNQTIYVTLYVD